MLRYILASSIIITIVGIGISKADSYASYTVTVSIHHRLCGLVARTGYAIENTYVIVTFNNLFCYDRHAFTEKHITVMDTNLVNHNVTKKIKLTTCTFIEIDNIFVLKTNSPILSSCFTLPRSGMYTTDSAHILDRNDNSVSGHTMLEINSGNSCPDCCEFSGHILVKQPAPDVHVGAPIYTISDGNPILLALYLRAAYVNGKGNTITATSLMGDELSRQLASIITEPLVKQTKTSTEAPPYVHLTIRKPGVEDSSCTGYVIEYKYLLIYLTKDNGNIDDLEKTHFVLPSYQGSPIDVTKVTKFAQQSAVVLEAKSPINSSSFLLLRWWMTDVRYPYILKLNSSGRPTRLQTDIKLNYARNTQITPTLSPRPYPREDLFTLPTASPMFINSNGKNILFGLLNRKNMDESRPFYIEISHVLSNDLQIMFDEFEPWHTTNINNIPYASLEIKLQIELVGFKPGARYGYLIEGRFILVTVEEPTELLDNLAVENIKVLDNNLLTITGIRTNVKSNNESIMILETNLPADYNSYHLPPVWFSKIQLLRIYLNCGRVYPIWPKDPVTTILKCSNEIKIKVELLLALPAEKTPLLGAPIISESDTKSTIFGLFAGFADESRSIIYIINVLSHTFRQSFTTGILPWTEGRPVGLKAWMQDNVVWAQIPIENQIITLLGTIHNNIAMFPIDVADISWNMQPIHILNAKVLSSDGISYPVVIAAALNSGSHKHRMLCLVTSAIINTSTIVTYVEFPVSEGRTHGLILTDDGLEVESLSLSNIRSYYTNNPSALIVAFDDTVKYYGIVPIRGDKWQDEILQIFHSKPIEYDFSHG